MKRPKITLRLAFMLGLLVVVLAAWAYTTYDEYTMRGELEKASREKVAGYERDFMRTPGTSIATAITTTHEYLFFGKPMGKVSVFIKSTSGMGGLQYAGVDITYERRDGKWVMMESGSCHGDDCEVRARKAFGDPV